MTARAAPTFTNEYYGHPFEAYHDEIADRRFNTVDVTLPKGYVEGSHSPAVVLFHGGGFTVGDKADAEMVRLAESLAAQGFVVFNANYRLASTTSDPSLGYPCPNAYEDADLVLDWMRKNAGRFGVDAANVTALGYSAGGPIAAHLGLTGPPEKRVQLVISIAGRMDFERKAIGSDSRVFFMPDGNYARYSPLRAVDAYSAPMIFIHAPNDLQVEVQHSRIMDAALRAKNIASRIFYADATITHGTVVDWSIDHALSIIADAVRAPFKSSFIRCAPAMLRNLIGV